MANEYMSSRNEAPIKVMHDFSVYFVYSQLRCTQVLSENISPNNSGYTCKLDIWAFG